MAKTKTISEMKKKVNQNWVKGSIQQKDSLNVYINKKKGFQRGWSMGLFK